ncbi:MAG: hypothetical protein DBY30_09190 [Verrucomicrobia bacterium]|nr:MAG: hypothetical protein DBY30_09190 [Verrucomicrobiota bacterium]
MVRPPPQSRKIPIWRRISLRFEPRAFFRASDFSCPENMGRYAAPTDYLHRPEILLRSRIGKSADSGSAQKQPVEGAAGSRDCGLSLNFCAESALFIFSSAEGPRISARQMKSARVKLRKKFLQKKSPAESGGRLCKN